MCVCVCVCVVNGGCARSSMLYGGVETNVAFLIKETIDKIANMTCNVTKILDRPIAC